MIANVKSHVTDHNHIHGKKPGELEEGISEKNIIAKLVNYKSDKMFFKLAKLNNTKNNNF